MLVSEPERGVLADTLHYLKLSYAKRLWGGVSQVSAQKTGANLGHRACHLDGTTERRALPKTIYRSPEKWNRLMRDKHRG